MRFNDIYHKTNRFLQYVILAIIVSFIVKGLSSWVVINSYEHVYTIMPSVRISVMGLFLGIFVITIAWLFSKKILIKKNVVFSTYFFIGLFWIIMTQVIPDTDAMHCFDIASEFSDGIFYSLEPGQYFDTYRLQAALILYEIVLTKIFGSYNYLAFQVINCLLWSYALSLVCDRVRKMASDSAASMFFFLSLLYTPIWMTVNFAYGNVVGMSLAVIALVLQNDAIDNDNILKGFVSCFIMAVACLIKGIMYIPFVAFIIMFICYAIKKMNFRYFVLAVVTIVIMLGSIRITDLAVNVISGERLRENGGTPTIAWIVMGSDIYADEEAPGWYNGTNVDIYTEAGYDNVLATDIGKERMRQVIKRIVGNPYEYVKALAKKNNTIWNEPTFEVFYRFNNTIFDSNLERHSLLWEDLASDTGRLHRLMFYFLKFIQVLTYVGVLLYIIFKKVIKDPNHYVGLLCFLGAYIFFSFYEAKSEYVLVFYIFLIPYSVLGWGDIFETIRLRKTDLINYDFSLGHMITSTLMIVLSIGISLLSFSVPAQGYYCNEDYDEYLKDYRQIYPGVYSIRSHASGMELFSNIFLERIHESYNDTFRYVLYDNSNRYYYKFLDWDEIDHNQVDKIAVSSGDSIRIEPWQSLSDVDLYQWRIVRESGGYIIKCWYDQNMVWTLDAENRTVYLDDYKANNELQVWDFN